MNLYSSILNTFILPIGDYIFGSDYLKNIKKWKMYDTKSDEELKQIQNNNLETILKYCTINVPYYKDNSFNANLSVLDNLKSFPILTKNILREKENNLISTEYNISSLDKNHSSGSSGVQSFTYMTKKHKFYLRALQTHWWTWSGYKVGDPLLQFGISQKRTFVKILKDLFYQCSYVKAFGLSKKEIQTLSKKISASKNIFIAGYPSVINELAKNYTENHYDLTVGGIICFGDKLFESHNKNIKKAWGENVPIIDTYGCAEGLLMACRYDLDYYYIMSPHVYIEIVDDNGKEVKDGEMGIVLVTCLTNFAMPIIRYKLGDLAIKLPKELYPSKRLLNYPLMQKIIGRETDIVKTVSGTILNVHSFTGVLEFYQEIKQYKIIQNDLESIIIEYIVDYNNEFDLNILEEIETKLQTLSNTNLTIHFKEVDKINPTASGKPQIIESNLK